MLYSHFNIVVLSRKVCIKVRVKALNSLLTCQLCILHLILLPVITPTKCVLKCGSDSANEPSNDVWLCLLLLSRRTRMTKLNRFFLVNRISHVFICVIGCWCLISKHATITLSSTQTAPASSTLGRRSRLASQASCQAKKPDVFLLDHLVLILVATRCTHHAPSISIILTIELIVYIVGLHGSIKGGRLSSLLLLSVKALSCLRFIPIVFFQ